MDIRIESLNNNQKKRLLSILNEDESNRIKLHKYNLKYPSFKEKIYNLNNAISELQENMETNKSLMETLNCNLKKEKSIETKTSFLNTLNNFINKNKGIQASINTLENQISDIKKEFSEFCIHKWMTELKYVKISDIKEEELDKHMICEESDINEINKTIQERNKYNYTRELNETIILQDWRKIYINKNFYNFDIYDRETYYICKTCNYHHTVHFYSK